jgi:spore germination protein KB
MGFFKKKSKNNSKPSSSSTDQTKAGQNEKINAYQFLILVILFTIGTGILLVPSGLATEVKQDAWIAAIVGTGIGLFVIWLLSTLALWFPHLTFIEINEKLFGKWIGKTVSLLFVSFSFLSAVILLFASGTFLTTHVLPETPMAALNSLMVIIMVMGVRLGLETIARSAEILIVVFFFLFIILVVFISPEIQFEYIQPVFEAEIKEIVKASFFLVITSSVNAVILLMIFPAAISEPKKARKSFFIGNLIGGLVIIIITMLCIYALGAETTARQMFPSYALAKKINVGDFVQRIEVLMASLWFISLYFKAALYFYASVLGMAQIFNLKDYRSLTLPLGMIAVVLSLSIFPNILNEKNWENTTSIPFSLAIGLFLPLLLIVVYALRKKLGNKKSKSS